LETTFASRKGAKAQSNAQQEIFAPLREDQKKQSNEHRTISYYPVGFGAVNFESLYYPPS